MPWVSTRVEHGVTEVEEPGKTASSFYGFAVGGTDEQRIMRKGATRDSRKDAEKDAKALRDEIAAIKWP